MDDVNHILSEHDRSVHMLRIRQGDERQRLLNRLDAKRHTRRTAAAGDFDDHELEQASSLGHVSIVFALPGSALLKHFTVVNSIIFLFY